MSTDAKRFLILTRRTAAFDDAVIAPHYAHLDALREDGRLELAGPFFDRAIPDRSGGAYLVRAGNLAEAEAIAFADPVHTSGSSVVTLHEWNASP